MYLKNSENINKVNNWFMERIVRYIERIHIESPTFEHNVNENTHNVLIKS